MMKRLFAVTWRFPCPAWALTLILLALPVLIPEAGATMKPPVDVTISMDPDHIPVEGELISLDLVFTTSTPVTLVEPDISSGRTNSGERNWEVVFLDIPSEVTLEPGTPRAFPVEIRSNAPTEPFFVEYRAGNFSERKTFFLTPFLNNQAVETPGDVMLSNPGLDLDALRPEPAEISGIAPGHDEGMARSSGQLDEEDGVPTQSVVRTAVGNIRYLRPDGWSEIYSGADGVTVRLYDRDSGEDDLLGTFVTDRWGNFVIDFVWLWEDDPDLYVRFDAVNAKVQVLYPGGLPLNYAWISSTKYNEPAETVSFGYLEPPIQAQMPILHAVTQLTRAWRLLANIGYQNIDLVKVRMPDSDWPHYKGGDLETIYMSQDRIWEDGTLWHEYGHHIVHEFGAGNGSDYCNTGSRCDYINGDDECRHCNWCQETAGDAWNEGFPSWFADVMTRDILAHYAILSGDPTNPYDYEVAGTCATSQNGTGSYDNPYLTEGLLAALLRDLEDGGPPDSDPLGGGVGQDKLNMSVSDIFDIMATFNPTTPGAFLGFYVAVHEQHAQNIWFTARNNGYNFDSTPPGMVSNLFSPSHNALPSPDATIEFTWDEPADDISGAGDYSVWISQTPQAPDYTADGIGDATSLVTNPLPAGIYWFSIRAVDRAGNWSDDWALYGPLAIRDPYPANLFPGSTASFSQPVVPEDEHSPNAGNVPDPDFLPPAPSETYLNLCVGNDGELATDGDFDLHARVDGALAGSVTMPAIWPVDPGEYRFVMNMGPYPIRGGRHTLGLVVDAAEELAEPSETDNTDQHQWVWSPYLSVPGHTHLDDAPPRPYAGWFDTPPLFQAPNCVGIRMLAGQTEAAAIYVLPEDLEDDYSLLSHEISTGPNNGFSYVFSKALSFRGPGLIDAVIVSPENAGGGAWDVGVLNHNSGRRYDEQGWRARCVESVDLPVETLVPVAWDETEALALFHSNFPPRLAPDQRVVRVVADPSVGPLNLAVYPVGTDHAGLLDHAQYARTGRLGHLSLSFEQSPGQWIIAAWRDPADQPDGAMPLEPASFTIELKPERPNLTPLIAAGWYSPLVPRSAGDGTPTSVPAPTTLVGDQVSTWLNAAFRNAGAHEASNALSTQLLDGVVVGFQNIPALAGHTNSLWNATSPMAVRGGRHTLSMKLDPDDTVEEEVEDDNMYGHQWAWVPTSVAPGPAVTRSSPPDPTGGWPEILAGGSVGLAFNVDGLRMAAPQPSGEDGHWQALAVAPAAGGDVDLRLFEADDSALTGFTDLKVGSIFGPGQTDYVLANFRATSGRALDVGIMDSGSLGTYDAEVVASTFLGSGPVGSHGSFTLPAGRLLALHEIELAAGSLSVELVPESGDIDWGMTLHRANLPLQSKNTPLDDAEAWTAPQGEGEQLGAIIPEAGHYCLAVWKASSDDAAETGEYRLVFGSLVGVDDTPAALPGRTAIASIVPNPFNPQTVVSFSTAAEGQVDLAVFDIRGRRIVSLVDRVLSSGHHEILWNGQDSSGRSMPSGVYFTRLQAAGEVDLGRMTLVR